jgi:hypothetical protein
MESTTKWVSGGFVCELRRGIGIDESYVGQARSLSNLERLEIPNISFDSMINDESSQISSTPLEAALPMRGPVPMRGAATAQRSPPSPR